MKEQTNWLMIIVIALGFCLVSLAIVKAPAPEIDVIGSGGGVAAEKNTISVVGQSTFDADPDEAVLYIRVKTEEPTSRQAQEQNARLMNTVRNALKGEGVRDSEMETTSYNLWPQQKYDRDTGEYINTGYVVQHLLKLTTDDVTEVGDLLDVAVDNGANGLDRVEFKLSDSKREDVNGEAIAQASDSASEKAEAIAQNLGVRIKGIYRVSESNIGYDYYPRPMMAMAESADMGRSFKTEISPETVRVSASISIVYEIE
jgi:uncharacterized protein YggE